MNQDNQVFIGKKDLMAYVFAVQTQSKINSEIKIKARGIWIRKAVDVSQISLNRFLEGWNVTKVSIGTDEIEQEDQDKKPKKISYINIELRK